MLLGVAPAFILASGFAACLTQLHAWASFLSSALFRWNLYVAFFAARSIACFADYLTATETFVAFDGYDAAAVADVAFHHALLGSKLARSFAFVAFNGN